MNKSYEGIKKIRLYPRGFMFSADEIKIKYSHFVHKLILGRYHYYYEQTSELHVCEDEENDAFIIIHGHFAYVPLDEAENTDNVEARLLELYKNDYDGFLDMLDFIGGRYAVIVGCGEDVRFYQDACSVRTVYYSLKSDVAASHLSLLADHVRHEIDPLAKKMPGLAVLFDYTPYSDVKAIIPNHCLFFFEKRQERFFPRAENKYMELTDDERIERVEQLWKGQLEQYLKKYKHFIFSISGGKDSRVSMAMIREHVNEIKSFTYYTPKKRILRIDYQIVKLMLRDLTMNHTFYLKDDNVTLSAEEKAIINKNAYVTHAHWLIPFYNEQFPEIDTMHLRSNVSGIARAHFIEEGKEESRLQDVIELIYSIQLHGQKKAVLEEKDKIEAIVDDGLKQLGYTEPMFGYHLLDMYLWEIRTGRWFPEVMNETDAAFDTFIPYNLRALLEIALSFDVKKRRAGYLDLELINRNWPVLNFYGKNSFTNLYEKNKRITQDYERELSIERARVERLKKELSIETARADKLQNKIEETRKEFFNTFKAFDAESNEYHENKTKDNVLYVPVEQLKKGCFAEAEIPFGVPAGGCLRLALYNSYCKSAGLNYMKYSILINGDTVLCEDIAAWPHKNDIMIHDVQPGDVVKVRIDVLRNCKSVSWKNASRLVLEDFEAIPSYVKNTREIICTSPYSTVYKRKA